MAEQNKGLLLTPEEIGRHWESWELVDCPDKEVAKSIAVNRLGKLCEDQLAKAKPIIEKQERERICNEVERYFKYLKDAEPPIMITDFLEIKMWWQALKGVSK